MRRWTLNNDTFDKHIFSLSPHSRLVFYIYIVFAVKCYSCRVLSSKVVCEAHGTKGAEQQRTSLLPYRNEPLNDDVFVFRFFLSANKDLSSLLTYSARGME